MDKMTPEQATAKLRLLNGKCANVRDIVEAYLTANGYEGLWDGEDCGCRLGDLIPCDGRIEWCKPAYIQLDGTLGPEKPKEQS